MSFKVMYLGHMREIERVEAHVVGWTLPGDSDFAASSLFVWGLVVTPSQSGAMDIQIGTGTSTSPTVFALYDPSMEAGATELIYDGTTVYKVVAAGSGKYEVAVRIKVKIKGGAAGLVTVARAAAAADHFVSVDGPDIALPSGATGTTSVYFEKK